jgi:hypothetical protein
MNESNQAISHGEHSRMSFPKRRRREFVAPSWLSLLK